MATKKKTTVPAAVPATAPGAVPSLQFIDLDVIDTLPQVRTVFEDEPLAELAESIKQLGMLQPVLLRPGQGKLGNRYAVIAGERRIRAARLAGLTSIPALVGEVPEERIAEMQLVENIQREQLSLAEAAAGVLAMYERHQSQKTVADLVGKSVPWVSKHLGVATKLGWRADNLLKAGAIEDLDLLMTIDQIDRTGKWYPRGDDLVAKIEKKEAGRAEARALLAQIRKDIEEAKLEKKAEAKAKAKQPSLNLESPKWHADLELATLHDDIANPEHKPVDELLAELNKEQLQAMVEEYAEEWQNGNQVHKATQVVKLRAMARFMDQQYSEIGFDTAAFILGASNIPLTIQDLAAELHQLMHAE